MIGFLKTSQMSYCAPLGASIRCVCKFSAHMPTLTQTTAVRTQGQLTAPGFKPGCEHRGSYTMPSASPAVAHPCYFQGRAERTRAAAALAI